MSGVDFKELEEKFFLTLLEPESTVLTMPASHLLEADNMMRLINTYSPLIHSGEPSTTVAFFCSWYAGVCGALQHMLVRGDGGILDLSLSNLSVQLYIGAEYPLFSFKINEVRFIEIPNIDYEDWCKALLYSFYRSQVRPLIEITSQIGQISVTPLWGQIVNALFAQMEEGTAKASNEENRDRISYHFGILARGIEVTAFGLRKNPFDIKPRFIVHPDNPNQMMLVKVACCMAYRLDAEFGYCYDCPRRKHVSNVR